MLIRARFVVPVGSAVPRGVLEVSALGEDWSPLAVRCGDCRCACAGDAFEHAATWGPVESPGREATARTVLGAAAPGRDRDPAPAEYARTVLAAWPRDTQTTIDADDVVAWLDREGWR